MLKRPDLGSNPRLDSLRRSHRPRAMGEEGVGEREPSDVTEPLLPGPAADVTDEPRASPHSSRDVSARDQD